MALVIADLVQETTSTTGTGTLTLTGAVTGFQTFAAIGNANTTYYRIKSGTDSEVGIGTYTLSGTTLSRDTVLYSSAGGTTKITVAAGATVICTYPAERAVVLDAVGNLGVGVQTATSKVAVTDTTLAASGSLAGSALDIAQTWNTTGNPTAIKLNVTNTASGTTSKLMDLQVGGSSKFSVGKLNGAVSFENYQYSQTTDVGIFNTIGGSGIVLTGTGFTVRRNTAIQNLFTVDGTTGIFIASVYELCWSTSGGTETAKDLKIGRDAANTLAQRNGVNSQTQRWYNTYTDASNYERGILSWVGNELTVGTEAAGTGTKRLLNINTPTSITGTTASDLPTYGSEFLSVPANFTLGAAWAGDNTTGFTHTSGAGNTATLTYSTLASNATKYQIVTTVTGRTTGSITLAFGGVSVPGITSTYATGPTTTATTGLVITPTFDFNGTIVISIKAITAVSSALVSFKDSGGTVRSEIRSSTYSGNQNSTFMGYRAGAYVTTGTGNSAFGYQALLNTTTGTSNTASGQNALYSNTTGYNNTTIGESALFNNTTGYNNTASGSQAGRYIADGVTPLTSANNCIYLGSGTKALADNVTNETVIGYNAIGSGSNTTTIGSSATTATKVFGVIATGQVATTLASAATIAPTLPIHFVSGVTTIDTITAPTLIATTGGQITLIPTGLFTISTAGNVALGTVAVVNKALILTYDATTTKWYPSY